MKTVFMTGGSRELALRHLLEKGVDVVALICPRPSNSNSRFLEAILTAHEFGIPVCCVAKNEVTATLMAINYDLLVSCGFSYVIDEDAIKTAKIMAINVHPTLLPKYRGYRSGPFIVMNGETTSGVTIHKLVSGLDKGDILLQKSFEVTEFDTTKSVFRKACEMEPSLLFEAISNIESGNITLTTQNEEEATEYNEIRTPKDSLIDVNKSFNDLYNFIRACDYNEYPAHFFINGEKVKIKLEREQKNQYEFDMI